MRFLLLLGSWAFLAVPEPYSVLVSDPDDSEPVPCDEEAEGQTCNGNKLEGCVDGERVSFNCAPGTCIGYNEGHNAACNDSIPYIPCDEELLGQWCTEDGVEGCVDGEWVNEYCPGMCVWDNGGRNAYCGGDGEEPIPETWTDF